MSFECPCCHSNEVIEIGLIPATNVFAGVVLNTLLEGASLYECRVCHVLFRWPRVPEPQQRKYYELASSDTWKLSNETRADWRLIAEFLGRLPENSSILDVGCFDGAFLSFLGTSYYKAGIEINQSAAKTASERGINVIGSDIGRIISETEIKYDIVVALDVIEHLESPALFIEKLVSLMKKPGYLIIASGNSNSFFWRLMGSRYWYCALAEHVSFINPAWCRWIASRSGLELVKLTAYSHAIHTSIALRIVEIIKNGVYYMSPSLASFIRKAGGGRIDIQKHKELAYYPPTFSSATDHILAIFRAV
jgi:2-polyprenyl-3-methyl-5-hydroxy-6-metoxy-1,4-benzoquinol methylase